MNSQAISVKGIYCIAIYICAIVLALFVENESMPWISDIGRWIALPLLLLFFYLNTDIDTKFEKKVFLGISLFSIANLLSIGSAVLDSYLNYIIIAMMMIAYFNYARALMAITSVTSTIFYQKKSLALSVFLVGLVGIYFGFVGGNIGAQISYLVPMICFGLVSLLVFMAGVNIYQQVNQGILVGFCVSLALLLSYNCFIGLNISPNISIFEEKLAITFYLGQLLFIWTAVRASLHFKKHDHSHISDVLKTKVVK